MKIRSLLVVATLMQIFTHVPSFACGIDTNCMVGDRHYRIRMPDKHHGEQIGAIVIAHGFGGSAHGMMKNESLAELSTELGIAIIGTKSAAKDWSIPGAPSKFTLKGVDELAYFDSVVSDVVSKFPIDEDRLMMAGFSAGGMMVWNLACFRSELFAAFVPIAGTFWQPEPTTCKTPATNIIHIHGDADKTVPLTGREVLDTHQGDAYSVLNMYSRYGSYNPQKKHKLGELSCEQNRNESGDILSFCLFPGGHTFKTEHLKHAWNTFVAAGKL